MLLPAPAAASPVEGCLNRAPDCFGAEWLGLRLLLGLGHRPDALVRAAARPRGARRRVPSPSAPQARLDRALGLRARLRAVHAVGAIASGHWPQPRSRAGR